MNRSVDVAIVGAGPAGICAAIETARRGARVLVIDENHTPGGQLFKQIHKFFGSARHRAGVRGIEIGRELVDSAVKAGAEFLTDSAALGVFPGPRLAVNVGNEEAIAVSAKRILLATGATENAVAFPRGTLPGVMGAGAAQTMLNVNRVLPGNRILMIGSGNVGLVVSYQLLQGGAAVLAVIEAAPRVGGYAVHANKIARAGVEILTSHVVTEARGVDRVASAQVAKVDDRWTPIKGTEREFEVDAICIATGLNAMTELARMAGCRIVHLRELGGYTPWHDRRMCTSLPEIYVAGDAAGVEEASSAMEKGRIAGISILEDLGFIAPCDAQTERDDLWKSLEALRQGPFGNTVRRGYDRLFGDESRCSSCTSAHRGEDFMVGSAPRKAPGYPSDTRLAKGPVAVIECTQEIPCNPCESACARHAITVGDPITSLPRLDEDKCNGCGRCIAYCSGLAIITIDAAYSDTEALMGFPYEFLPCPNKGDEVSLVDRLGKPIARGRVMRVTKPMDGTRVVYAVAPKELIHDIRGIKWQAGGESQ